MPQARTTYYDLVLTLCRCRWLASLGDCLAVDFTYWYITSVIQQLCDVLFWTSYRDYHQLRSCWFVIYFGCGRRQLAWKLFGMAGCVLGTPLAISAGASGGIMGLGAFYFHWHCYRHPLHLS